MSHLFAIDICKASLFPDLLRNSELKLGLVLKI